MPAKSKRRFIRRGRGNSGERDETVILRVRATGRLRLWAIGAIWRINLERGRPLIVSLKASGPHGPLHYVVVVGIDSAKGTIYVKRPGAAEDAADFARGIRV